MHQRFEASVLQLFDKFMCLVNLKQQFRMTRSIAKMGVSIQQTCIAKCYLKAKMMIFVHCLSGILRLRKAKVFGLKVGMAHERRLR